MTRNIPEEEIPLTADLEVSDNSTSRARDTAVVVGEDVEKHHRPAPIQIEKREIIPWSALPNKDQLCLLALCRLSEPLSNTCLLPYIFYLMKSIVVPDGAAPDNSQKKQISELSGILVAVFPLAQLATSMLWARWADIHGRRKTIVGALLVSAISNLGFGFSRSFWGLMFWRTMAGLANGNVGVMRTMTAEIVKERKYQTKAFLLLPLIFNAGMVLGLALGGVLADPASNLSWLFGSKGLFNFFGYKQGVAWTIAFPYSLPALWNFACLSISLVLSIGGLKETLEGRDVEDDVGLQLGRAATLWVKQRLGRTEYISLLAEEPLDSMISPLALEKAPISASKPVIARTNPPPRNIWTRDVICALVSSGLLPFHNNAFMHLFPIFLSQLPSDNSTKATGLHFNGGLGLKSRTIGLYLSCFGLCGIFLQLFIYPRLQVRYGTLGVFRIASYTFPLTYFFAPFLALLPQASALRWIAIALVAWSQIMARTLAIPSTVILLTNSAPSKSVLGRIHGAGNSAASLARCIGPALSGWVFAKGMDANMVGMVWWFYLLVIASVALAWSFTMRKID